MQSQNSTKKGATRTLLWLAIAVGTAISTGCVSTGRTAKDSDKGSHRALMVAVVPGYLSKFMCADPAYRRCFGLDQGMCESQMRRYGRTCENVVFPPQKEYYTRDDLQDVGLRYGRCIMDTHRKVTNRGTIDDAQCIALMPRRVDSATPANLLPVLQPPAPRPVVNTVSGKAAPASGQAATAQDIPLAKTYPVTE